MKKRVGFVAEKKAGVMTSGSAVAVSRDQAEEGERERRGEREGCGGWVGERRSE